LGKVFSAALADYCTVPINLSGDPMTTEIVSVVGCCVFAGITMICVAQFFRTKFPPSGPPGN
ncbi:MAG: hypothetical protein WA801_07195, partial [Pseudolabrys sp.]